jgi:hypothetical protein
MASSRIAGQTLADEGAHVIVRHFLALVLRHGWTPFEHTFESIPNAPHIQPVCSFVENSPGKSRMERRSSPAEDRLPPARSCDHMRAKRAPSHPARSRESSAALWGPVL